MLLLFEDSNSSFNLHFPSGKLNQSRMDEKTNDSDKSSSSVDADFMLPGFRFHPTDEELVEFYLKRKLQHRPLAIELIKQVDIYKYDPWDLPKLASTGEKEWYFYCPRDRKYRNSTRPNRVTGSGFWKATGTDRPIYSSDGGKCIGLKKSLVFYRGRAAKGMKTDWMMHEFRLPSVTDGGPPPPPQPHKKIFDKSLPPNDSWAICRIFKKTNSTANRALSHAWTTPSLSDTTTTSSDAFPYTNFNDFHQSNIFSSAPNISSYRTSASNGDYFTGNLVFSPPEEVSGSNKTTVDLTTTMFFDQSTGKNSDQQHQFNGGYPVIDGEDDQEGFRKSSNIHHMWENIRSMGFPFSLPPAPPNLPWESPPCPSEISSTTYSTNKCYI